MDPLLKRSFDIAVSAAGLVLLLPLGLLLALGIRLSDGGPVFFAQTRIGRFGRPFRMWKFRSMVVDAERKGIGVTSGADRRITSIGRFLRKTKLDELPQLWNVLRGDMSFVGPRPELPRYVELYTPEQRRVLELRPGITDAATVAFRNEEELLRGADDVEAFYIRHCLPAKIELNLDYARRATFLRDLWILFQTLCPYWLGILGLYAVTLAGSLLVSALLLADFHWSREEARSLLRFMPWLVGPQLICLFWQGQARGLLSYFSIPEMRRTGIALAVAFLLQFALVRVGFGDRGPGLSLLLTHLIMSFFALCGVRMGVRLLRERSTSRRRSTRGESAVRRVAIVGLDDAATNLALDLIRSPDRGRRVVAFFDDDPRNWQKRPYDIPVFGMPECLLNPEWHRKIDEVIIALPSADAPRAAQIVGMLRGAGLSVVEWRGV